MSAIRRGVSRFLPEIRRTVRRPSSGHALFLPHGGQHLLRDLESAADQSPEHERAGAQQAEDKHRLDAFLTEAQQDSRKLEALLRHFEEAGVLRSDGRSMR